MELTVAAHRGHSLHIHTICEGLVDIGHHSACHDSVASDTLRPVEGTSVLRKANQTMLGSCVGSSYEIRSAAKP